MTRLQVHGINFYSMNLTAVIRSCGALTCSLCLALIAEAVAAAAQHSRHVGAG